VLSVDQHWLSGQCRTLGLTVARTRTPGGSESTPSVTVGLPDGSSVAVSGFGVRHSWVFRGATPDILTDAEVKSRRLPTATRKANFLHSACDVDALALYVVLSVGSTEYRRVISVGDSMAPAPPAPAPESAPEKPKSKK